MHGTFEISAIIIAGALLANAQGWHRAACAIATRLAGDRGSDFADLAEATVRSVAQGILGVALIQTLLAGIGFLVVGVPGAGQRDASSTEDLIASAVYFTEW